MSEFRNRMQPIEVGQFFRIGKSGNMKKEFELVAEWGNQLLFRQVGSPPNRGIAMGTIVDRSLVEKGRFGNMAIYGQLNPEERRKALESFPIEVTADPTSTSAKQVGVDRLTRGVAYLFRSRSIIGVITAVRDVRFLQRAREDIFFREAVPVDERIEVAVDPHTRGTLDVKEGIIVVNQRLVVPTSNDPGVTIWRPGHLTLQSRQVNYAS